MKWMIAWVSLWMAFPIYAKSSPPDTTERLKTMKGVCFVAPRQELNSNPFEPIKQLGANYVAVIPYAFCREGEPKVNYDYERQWWGETVEGARQTIQYAKAKGLNIMLKPHLWIGGDGWPGSLTFEQESAWQTWEQTYTNYILRFARMAEEMDVTILTIGTECKQIVRDRPQFWRSLIKKVKKVYNGKLTYQANWDNFKHVPFWDQLDYISVSGYFPITDEKQPPEATIANGWEQHLASLKRMHLAYDKPVIFGEFGYCSKQGALSQPWEGGRQDPAPVNMEVQQKGYRVLFQEVWPQPWFQGGFLWKWHADHQHAGGSQNNRYTPQNKPVEKLIQNFYKAQ